MLTVYGATGYSGKLIVRRLAELGVPMTLAGRNPDKLESLRRNLHEGSTGGAPPEIRVETAALDDPQALLALARRSKVILHCAGPYRQLGPPMLEACLAGGAHYFDLTGEVRFMAETLARDDEAKRAGIALVNAVGLDVVPSDLLAHLVTEALGAVPDRVDIAMSAKGLASSGTRRSLLGVLAEKSLALVDGQLVDEPIAATHRAFAYPSPYRAAESWNGPLGDIATVARTTGTRNARTYIRLPSSLGPWARYATPLAGLILRGPVLALAKKTIAPDGQGPTAEERSSARFAFVVEAEASGKRVRGTIMGYDAYGLTAVTAARVATHAMEDRFNRSGALSPMQVLDPAEWRTLLESEGRCHIAISAIE